MGVFGGTFDPVHHAHLIVAAEAFEALNLDLLLFVPAAEPPHKRGSVVASAEQRMRMLSTAIEGDPRFRVDDLELRRPGPSYTVDTLQALREREPEAEIFFLLGVDQFRDFGKWREPDRIVRLARLAVLARGGETVDVDGPYPATAVAVSRIDISGTEIRKRTSEGRSVRYYVPEGVREIIERERIY